MSLASLNSSYTQRLPNLLGSTASSPSRPGTIGKKQVFTRVGGVPFVVEDLPPITAFDGPQGTLILPPRTASPSGKRIMNQDSGQIFKFDAYFEEMALHTRLEKIRIRKCNIFFYEDDNSIMIVEQPQLNSGMPQGTILRKTVVSKPDGSFYSPQEFTIGSTVNIYGTIYNIVDSDSATRRFLEDESPTLPYPFDAFEEQRKQLHTSASRKDWGAHHSKKNELKNFIEAKLGNTVNNDGREGFLKYGNSVLKFLCIWDDTATLYGDVNEFTFIYYLSDDTIEIFSNQGPNSGRDPLFARLLRRSRLPKYLELGSAYTTLSTPSTQPQGSLYHWSDLSIGTEINVYGRALVLVDADQSTRYFYSSHGIQLMQGGRPKTSTIPKAQREIPPHNGFGSEEDSLMNCTGPLSNTLSPKKVVREEKCLSFVCEMIAKCPEDAQRRFVATYFVTDSTLKVHEIPAKNSGFVGGVFLSRGKVKGENQQFITEKDLYVGAKIMLNRHMFRVIDTNENTLRWMEMRRFTLPKSDFVCILDKLRAAPALMDDAVSGLLLEKFERADKRSSGLLDKAALMAVLSEYCMVGDEDEQLCEHELLTVVRMLSQRSIKFEYKKLIGEMLSPSSDDDLYSL